MAAHLPREGVIEAVPVRWQVAAFHRRFQHLTGMAKCPCCKAAAQRTPLTGGGRAGVWRPQHAHRVGHLGSALQQPWAPCRRPVRQKALSQVLTWKTAAVLLWPESPAQPCEPAQRRRGLPPRSPAPGRAKPRGPSRRGDGSDNAQAETRRQGLGAGPLRKNRGARASARGRFSLLAQQAQHPLGRALPHDEQVHAGRRAGRLQGARGHGAAVAPHGALDR